MSQQKITIALIGDPDGLPLLEDAVLSFAEYHKDSNPPLDSNIKTESAYVLKNFSFKNYQVDILKVTEFDKNLPRFDGVILCTLPLPFIEEPNPAFKRSFQMTFASENPYDCLAEKLDCVGDSIQQFFLTPKNPERDIEEIKHAESSTIEESLLNLIRSKEVKEKLYDLKNRLTNIDKQNKFGLLPIPLIFFAISISVLIVLGVFGILLTPFLSIPIVFFVAGCVVGGAIWLANRKKTLSEIPKEPDGDSQSEILSSVNNNQTKLNPHPYSETLKKPTEPAKNLALAQKAAEKLRMIFNSVFYEEIQKTDLNSFMIENPALKITFKFSESGEIFLECANKQPGLKEATLQFQQYEQKLKNLLGNDAQMNRIPITQVNNLSELDHIVEKQKNNEKFG